MRPTPIRAGPDRGSIVERKNRRSGRPTYCGSVAQKSAYVSAQLGELSRESDGSPRHTGCSITTSSRSSAWTPSNGSRMCRRSSGIRDASRAYPLPRFVYITRTRLGMTISRQLWDCVIGGRRRQRQPRSHQPAQAKQGPNSAKPGAGLVRLSVIGITTASTGTTLGRRAKPSICREQAKLSRAATIVSTAWRILREPSGQRSGHVVLSVLGCMHSS